MAQAAKRSTLLAHRNDERTLRTRQKLICAAMYEFGSRGFEATTTKSIASRAGVPQSALKHHFDNKAELWTTAAEKVFGEFHTTFGTVLETTAGMGPRDRAETLITEVVVFFAQHPEFHRFLTGADCGSERLKWLATTHVRPLHRVFDALLADLDETLDEVPDREHLFYMFVGAAAAPYEMHYEYELGGTSPFKAEAVNRHARSMIRTFLPPEL